jgi:hypothetical protein
MRYINAERGTRNPERGVQRVAHLTAHLDGRVFLLRHSGTQVLA